MTLRHALTITLAAISLAAATPTRAAEGFAGDWKGTSDGEVSFTLKVTDTDGALAGVIDIPSQGIQDQAVDLSVENDSLTGHFTTADGTETSFTGKLNEAGAIVGTYEQGPNSGTFEMNRAAE
jgi:hypothetical protein